MKEILFTDTEGVTPEFFPKPAKNFLPSWYKQTPSYNGKKEVYENGASFTIKKCAPVFDALTAGYIIPTWADVWVKNENGNRTVISPTPTMKVTTHSIGQFAKHPLQNNTDALKFMNPWSIKTPKGYSCMFVTPFHNPNPYFEAFEAIVDTDTFYSPTNLPFLLKDPDFEGLIPAGTPIIQVIPFKRDPWVMKFGDATDELNSRKKLAELKVGFFNSYRSRFWDKKSFN